MVALKIAGGVLGGILIVAGGVYLIRKTECGREIIDSMKNIGSQIKNSFKDGYSEAMNS
ncbi:MAG: hypothetical protein HQK49_04555 [Oligoflexia bacterium]|nr:hypothetical protein [Oligoflexia bacterium]